MIRSRNLSAYAVASVLWFFSSAAVGQSALPVRAKAAAAAVDSSDAVAAHRSHCRTAADIRVPSEALYYKV